MKIETIEDNGPIILKPIIVNKRVNLDESPYVRRTRIPMELMWQSKDSKMQFPFEQFTMICGFVATVLAIHTVYHCFTVWGVGVWGSNMRKG